MRKLKKQWLIASKRSSNIVNGLLSVRGVSDVDRFLHPKFDEDLHDPCLLPNFDQAIELIGSAINNNTPIGIFGDYDVDGITGSALMYLALQKIGVNNLEAYIPRRNTGYGLSNKGIDDLEQAGVKLVLAIDCGVTSVAEIEYAKSKGMSVVVLDHHEPHDILPNALIVNPKLSTSTYPFRELCGAGVVYKVIQGLSKLYPKKLTEAWLKWHLDLVTVATICDMVPLVDENRVISKFGLGVMRKSRNLGLLSLAEVSGVNLHEIDTYHVGFLLGPRLNAVGRMNEDPNTGLELLITESDADAKRIAKSLNRHNLNRQEYLLQSMEQADRLMQKDNQESPVIVLQHSDWTPGILGLIASRIVERYHKPTFIFEKTDGEIRGSARSTSYLPLPQTLEAVSDYLTGYGGHAFAAGLSLEGSKFADFKCALEILARKKLENIEQSLHLHIDMEIKLSDINSSLYKSLKELEPFGLGNSKPIFMLSRVRIMDVRKMGTQHQHFRGYLEVAGAKIGFVAFNLTERMTEFTGELDVAFSIEENYWNGNSKIELHVKDFRPSLDVVR